MKKCKYSLCSNEFEPKKGNQEYCRGKCQDQDYWLREKSGIEKPAPVKKEHEIYRLSNGLIVKKSLLALELGAKKTKK